MRDYAMDQERKRRKTFIIVMIIGIIALEYIAIRAAERVGFVRGYNYGMETIID